MDIIKELKHNRPNLSNGSLKTYKSILSTLYVGVYGDDDDFQSPLINGFNMNKFNDDKKILNFLKDKNYRTRKTILSALVVLTDNDNYKDLMNDDINDYKEEENKQIKSEKVDDNWVNNDQIIEIYKDQYKKALSLFKKANKTTKDFQDLQDYIILSLYNGMYIPPRRSKDYTEFKISDIDKDEDNYLNKNIFIFNNYKTSKTYGQQKVTIPVTLLNIIKKWISINPTDYLLFDKNGNKLNSIKLNQRLNKIFNKHASVNQMRKTYMSSKYSDFIETNKEMSKDFKDMGSSMAQQNIYIKS